MSRKELLFEMAAMSCYLQDICRLLDKDANIDDSIHDKIYEKFKEIEQVLNTIPEIKNKLNKD